MDKIDGHIIEYKYLVDCILKYQMLENATFEDMRKALELSFVAARSVKINRKN